MTQGGASYQTPEKALCMRQSALPVSDFFYCVPIKLRRCPLVFFSCGAILNFRKSINIQLAKCKNGDIVKKGHERINIV